MAAEEARIAEEEKAKKLAEEQALIAAEARRREEAAKVSLDESQTQIPALVSCLEFSLGPLVRVLMVTACLVVFPWSPLC